MEDQDVFLSKQIFVNIILVARKWEVYYNRCHAKDDLTLKQILVLIVAAHVFEDDPTITELSNNLSSSHQNIKAILTQLEKKGYVRLYKDAYDKRISRAKVLTKGLEGNTIRDEKDTQLLRELFATISLEDLDVTLRTLETLNTKASSLLNF